MKNFLVVVVPKNDNATPDLDACNLHADFEGAFESLACFVEEHTGKRPDAPRHAAVQSWELPDVYVQIWICNMPDGFRKLVID